MTLRPPDEHIQAEQCRCRSFRVTRHQQLSKMLSPSRWGKSEVGTYSGRSGKWAGARAARSWQWLAGTPPLWWTGLQGSSQAQATVGGTAAICSQHWSLWRQRDMSISYLPKLQHLWSGKQRDRGRVRTASQGMCFRPVYPLLYCGSQGPTHCGWLCDIHFMNSRWWLERSSSILEGRASPSYFRHLCYGFVPLDLFNYRLSELPLRVCCSA